MCSDCAWKEGEKSADPSEVLPCTPPPKSGFENQPWLNRLKLSGLSEKFSYPNECGTGTGGEGMRDLLALAIEVAS